MSEVEGSTAVLERNRPDQENCLTVHVRRHGEYGRKALRFTVGNFDIVSKQHVYNIQHVIGLEKMVDSFAVHNGSGDIFVHLHRWQLITEELAVMLAHSIGNALGFVPGAIVVTLDRLE